MQNQIWNLSIQICLISLLFSTYFDSHCTYCAAYLTTKFHDQFSFPTFCFTLENCFCWNISSYGLVFLGLLTSGGNITRPTSLNPTHHLLCNNWYHLFLAKVGMFYFMDVFSNNRMVTKILYFLNFFSLLWDFHSQYGDIN